MGQAAEVEQLAQLGGRLLDPQRRAAPLEVQREAGEVVDDAQVRRAALHAHDHHVVACHHHHDRRGRLVACGHTDLLVVAVDSETGRARETDR